MHSLTEVTLKNPKAKQSNITSEENGHILHFTVTAANGSEKEYTVYVKADAVPKIEQAEELVKTEIWTIAMNEANSEETVKQWIQNKIDSMDLGGITYELVMGDVTPAIGGTNENKAGTDGSFNFTVKLTSEDGGNQSNKDVEITGKIKADKYKEIPIVETDINVSFRLIGAKLSRGDIDLADGDYKGGDYVTWIKTKNYALPAQSTVYALFNRALGEAGLNSQGADQNYVKTIYAPSVCGGYELSHFTNGPKSGWMYTVNGKHPNLGLKEYKLNNGDNVVFHYVNDYRYEVDDWKGSGEHPSLGDGKLHNKWLEAEDKDPTKVNAEESITTYTSEAGNITTVKADVKISKETVGEKTINKAIITIKDENIPEILKQAKKNESEAIILDANVKEANADKVMVEISKKTAEDILKETKADLVIALPETELKLSRDALKEIASQAKGDKLTMEIEKVNTPTDEQKKLAGESAEIFTLNIKGGDTAIHDFGKGMVTVRKLIPDRLKEKKVAAVYLTEKDQLEVLKGKKIVIDKHNFYEFTTNHFSYFALVDADEAGIEAEEMMSVHEVKNLVKTLKLKVKTKALKKSVRVIVKADKTTLNNLRDNGYTVKYKLYRATKKTGKFKLVSTKDLNKYTNVKITKGKTYYYKAKIFVYDSLGNLVTKTSFKQCNIAKAKVKAFKKAA